jgi:8-oxo-dGTP pyrophosphatase MutT (NUDIX family)
MGVDPPPAVGVGEAVDGTEDASEAGTGAVAVPVRDAATVVLLRDGSDGLEVWLQQRSPALVFAAGMHAFPGGAVDDADRIATSPVIDAAAHAQIWRCDVAQARALVLAAVRETLEEADVALPTSTLVPWSRWVTPPGPPRRFDAHFFVSWAPSDATPRPCTGEVHDANWVVVRSAVEREAAGDLPMWPPTIATLAGLAPFDTVAEVMAAAPTSIEAVTE